MTRRDILSIALKILGIYFLLQTIRFLPFFVTIVRELRYGQERPAFLSFAVAQVGVVLVSLVAAIILLKWSDGIAARLTKDYKYEPSAPVRWLGRNELLEVAFTVVGVVIIANVLPRIPQIIADLRYEGSLREHAYTSAVAVAVRVVLGFYLALGAKGLASLISKLRAGTISDFKNAEPPESTN